MKKTWKLIIVVGLAILLGANLILDLRDGTPVGISEISDIPVGISKGEQAPDIEGITLEGKTLNISDFRGKTLVINVFASWCGPCQIEAPHLAQVYADLGGDDVEFIGLNLEERPEDVALFKEKFDWEFPLVLNQNGDLTEIYQPLGLPTSWFIDAEGVIQYVHTGPITSEMLVQVITDIQEGRDPNPFARLD
jgi:thiol-disulfide isomerase/thioredoxin